MNYLSQFSQSNWADWANVDFELKKNLIVFLCITDVHHIYIEI